MKILIFLHSLSYGGAERVSANLANYWSSRNWDVTVVTLASTDLDCYELDTNIKRISLELASESENFLIGFKNNIKRICSLRKFLRQTKPDIALSMMSTANILLACSGIGFDEIIKIGSERSHPPATPINAIWNKLREYCYRNLNVIVALTTESAEWLKKNTKANEVIVIPNSAYWPLPKIQPYLKPINKFNSKKILLAVGRLSDQKNYSTLISIFSDLSNLFSQWNLIILGEGPTRKSLEIQINNAGLSQRIFLLGRAGNIGEWYELADIFVLTSHFEGFPNALVEAMAYGLPAVSFDCETGPRDIIRHEIDGLLIPNSDTSSFKEGLKRLMNDELLRQLYAKNAIEVRQRFSLERIANMWQRVIEDIKNE